MITILLVLGMVLYLGILTEALSILAIGSMIAIVGYKWKGLFSRGWIWYVVALVLAIAGVVFHDTPYVQYITKGWIGYAFFLNVMMVGILPNKWTFSRNLKKNRGVFSILGFIFISPHAFLHIFGYLDGINLFGIVAYVIMIPLTLISFQIIRREIPPKDWLTVQKAAYAIYVVLFAHLLWVGDWPDKVVYAVLATIYVNNKLIKEFRT